MARKVNVIEIFTCDHCGAEMTKSSNQISWVTPIDRDVVERITVNITGVLDWVRGDLHVCKNCAVRILKSAVSLLESDF